jgi:hypothetical protein
MMMVKLFVVLIVSILALLCFSGCTSFGSHRMFADSDNGFVMLAGDAEGIRAYNDGLLGLVTETKTSPDIKGPYWQAREKETDAKVLRFRATKAGGVK